MLDYKPSLLPLPVLEAVWGICEQAHASLQESGSLKRLQCSLTLLSMAAAKEPALTTQHLGFLLEVRDSSPCTEALAPLLGYCNLVP